MTFKRIGQKTNSQDYSRRIRDLRARLNLSQEKLAARLGVSLPTINRWEKGKSTPNGFALKAIEQFIRRQGDKSRDLHETYAGTHPVLDMKSMEGLLRKAARSVRIAEAEFSSVRASLSAMLHLFMTGQVRLSPKMIAMKKHTGKVDDGVLQQIVRRIVEVVSPEKILLFGSAARGEMGPDSDIDLLIVKDVPHRRRAAQEIRRHLRGVLVPVDLIVATPGDLEEYKDTIGLIYRPALREGKVVYAA